MSAPERLYGEPDAECLYDDIATVWETAIDPLRGEYDPDEEGCCGPWTIQEHLVLPPIDSVRSAGRIVEDIEEWVADEGEFTDDPWQQGRPSSDPDVIAAAERLREAIAGKVSWFQAGEVVEVHTITLVDGEPWLDGEPMYRLVKP